MDGCWPRIWQRQRFGDDNRKGALRIKVFRGSLEIYISTDHGDTGVPADSGGPRRIYGSSYYKMMLIYVDDVLHIAEDPEEDMKKLAQVYRLKGGVGTLDRYLGGNMERVQTSDGSVAWSLSCYDYLINAIQEVEDELSQKDLTLKKFGTGLRPYPACYRPEVDVSQVLDAERSNRFQQLIGILRWAIELGRIYILTEVSCLSQHLAEPREGHLIAVYKIFKYLSLRLKSSKGRIVFNGKSMIIDNVIFNDVDRQEWKDFYHDAHEEMPMRMTEPLGKPIQYTIACVCRRQQCRKYENKKIPYGYLDIY